jgi:hypothetical protein
MGRSACHDILNTHKQSILRMELGQMLPKCRRIRLC